MTTYPKRLIEVDLPIGIISENARRDQNVRKGHLHSMHVWWATRPLASCRAVVLASMLPDPVDPECPSSFSVTAQEALKVFTGRDLRHPLALRQALLDFVAAFSSWDAGVSGVYLDIARRLVSAAHPGGAPLLLDPFAGAGSIPVEALRVGASTYASDLNPIPVMMNKVSQEYLPAFRERLTEAVAEHGDWVLNEARARLKVFYPSSTREASPLFYSWARTIRCEGPSCGAEVPMLGMLSLSRKPKNRVALSYRGIEESCDVAVELVHPSADADVQPPISRRFNVTCPVCGFTTPYKNVREQLRARHGGTQDARLLAIAEVDTAGNRSWRLPEADDLAAVTEASTAVRALAADSGTVPWIPDEPFPKWYSGVFNPGLWGIDTWGALFSLRQSLAIGTFCKLAATVREKVATECGDPALADAVATCVGLAVTKTSIYNTANCYVHPDFGLKAAYLGSGMAMVGDFSEVNPLIEKYVGGFDYSLQQMVSVLRREEQTLATKGIVRQGSATRLPLPDDSVAYVVTDPPYYAAVPYSDLSDLCYVWAKRALGNVHPDLLAQELTPKDEELIAYYVQPPDRIHKDGRFFEDTMRQALQECRRVLGPDGIAVIIFAHKGTAGWEAMLSALVDAGWTVTASWPIDTENRQRWRAARAATLSSSVHLVCRPRENPDGSLRQDVGEWRDVLAELPERIHEWMPRLASEGVVGADAIFACLGPALEIFSRFGRVEKSSGQPVPLREYLEQVWAAVSKEALSMIFDDPETGGLEPDARLTAMWLWTLGLGPSQANGATVSSKSADVLDDHAARKDKTPGFALEFDAARKIAQGLGIHLEKAPSVVEVKRGTARLLSVAERTRFLFGKDAEGGEPAKRTKKVTQLGLFEQLLEFDAGVSDPTPADAPPKAGGTVLDRVHQAMILFAAGRGEALKTFLVEEGTGTQANFWKLAQALSALYPTASDEKRWVDGVLARKQGLGL